jgi:hypothetical protein
MLDLIFVLSPVLEYSDKQICGTIIIVFIRKQHSLSSNYVMQILSDVWTDLNQPHCYACPIEVDVPSQ